MTDQEPIAAAILDALNTALTPVGASAYDLDGVPSDSPAERVVIRLYRYATSVRRADGTESSPGYFLDTIYRAGSVQGCRELRRITALTLESRIVAGYGIAFNDETQPIDDDPDYGYSGVDTFDLA